MKKSATAFSLIEITLVILVIGIMIVGVISGSRLVQESRLKSAQVLTQNSPVKDISSLVLWYETSLPESFIATEALDGAVISTWYDNNPNAAVKNNAVQVTAGSQPIFYENIFNHAIPAIRFDGSNDFMTFDGSILANTSYTIFVVEQRRSSGGNNYFIGGTASSTDTNLTLGYSANTTITQDHYSDQITYGIASYASPTPRIHTFVFNNLASTSISGKRYWLNGSGNSSVTNASDTAQTSPITSYVGSGIGRSTSYYFNGDVAEIIIFSRNLTSQERWGIEDYLSKKYGIKVAK